MKRITFAALAAFALVVPARADKSPIAQSVINYVGSMTFSEKHCPNQRRNLPAMREFYAANGLKREDLPYELQIRATDRLFELEQEFDGDKSKMCRMIWMMYGLDGAAMSDMLLPKFH